MAKSAAESQHLAPKSRKKNPRRAARVDSVSSPEWTSTALEPLLDPILYVAYAPYQTFSNPLNTKFVDSNSKRISLDNADTESLFKVGREAYGLLLAKDERRIWEAYPKFRDSLNEARNGLQKMFADGLYDDEGRSIFEIVPVNKSGARSPATPTHPVSESPTIKVLLDLMGHTKEMSLESECFAIYRLISCFEAIDQALSAMQKNGFGVVAACITAVEYLGESKKTYQTNTAFNGALRGAAVAAARARHAQAPERQDMQLVLGYYKQWRDAPTRYRSAAQFARVMIDKCIHITDERTILKWVRNWEKKLGGN